MPTFNGVNIFGPIARFVAKPEPNQFQVNAYPGVNGLESLNMGSRGSVIQVTGQLVAPDGAGLSAAQDVFWTLQRAGTSATLVDPDGRSYPETYLEDFAPADEDTCFLADGTGVVRGYMARFRCTY